MRVLVIDCGGTQATAAIFNRPDALQGGSEDGISYISLPHGLNAATATRGAFEVLCRQCSDLDDIAHEVGEVYFYGAGCAGDAICSQVADELLKVFHKATRVEVATDMLASARAMCGDESGIVAILGTGSNSCLYDGTNITKNVSPLGYILGDEGSGAVLGRLFLGRVLKQQFPQAVLARFSQAFPYLTTAGVITKVYRDERPNAYLASFCPFISSCLDIPEVEAFVTDEFKRFISYNLLQYTLSNDSEETPKRVHITGSIAHHFSAQFKRALREVCDANGHPKLILGKILPTPLPSLAQYHVTH